MSVVNYAEYSDIFRFSRVLMLSTGPVHLAAILVPMTSYQKGEEKNTLNESVRYLLYIPPAPLYCLVTQHRCQSPALRTICGLGYSVVDWTVLPRSPFMTPFTTLRAFRGVGLLRKLTMSILRQEAGTFVVFVCRDIFLFCEGGGTL